ncbi:MULTISPECIES: Gfo/Idh/MocA family protein [Marinilabiliaceae]|uniref:Tat (Twin-arginine translocation) pathway signal sequence n=2 Tax=Marinilabiliaceae TaxID=558415 RepID=A0A1T5HRW7_9BACT|nr:MULTISPECIES: Gfo/Idh/MocA family oxidoreductase [Marinilabiliaceae]ASB50059.1 oxidoreductase [Alkalitalea saponilacus]TCO08910.1 secreted protein [Natronoflexus pectinivorans]SKC23425.1 Tat (twin-arginine translocation) pathway signal sequence [Alkalitalea saponilacus]
MKSKIGRRDFLQKSGAAAVGLSVLPGIVSASQPAKPARRSPGDKLRIAGVGVGGRGFAVLRAMESEEIVALCDVDWRYSKNCFDYWPKAKKYWDWRKMLDEMGDEIDAVMVATADHTHAAIAATAITMGKHVYVEKPLTHTVYESRLLTKLAKKYKVATQMGNQGASEEGVSLVKEWIQNGEIGEVTRVEAFTDRPIWPQGLNTPTQGQWVPDHLNWDLFVGPAKMRPYNEIYTPWNFRGWWDYGTGALGDMACHILHPVFKGLNLGYPTRVQGSSTLLLQDCAPVAEKVRMIFPERARLRRVRMPEVEVHWYDGGLQPLKPDNWPAGKSLNVQGGGALFYGTKDILHVGCYGREPFLLSGRVPNAPKTERRINVSHEMDWVRACKESPENRTECSSAFDEAGPFNEMVVMGVLAVRLQALNKELHWDGENMRFTNIGDDETIRTVIKDGFEIRDGHPTFDQTWTEPVNAKKFAEELIKHEYRKGWSLPDMPA